MLTRVFLRQDAGAGFVKPGVATSVIEVPVRIDQLLDGIAVDTGEGFGDVRLRGENFGVHEQLAVGAGEDSDISARAEKNGDVAAQRLDGEFCGGGYFKRLLN